MDRPQILPKQNLSPQGENMVIFLRKIRKTTFFRRAINDRPYKINRKMKFFDSLKGRVAK